MADPARVSICGLPREDRMLVRDAYRASRSYGSDRAAARTKAVGIVADLHTLNAHLEQVRRRRHG